MEAARGLLDLLGDWGVRYVFTCPGSTEAPFLEAALGHPDVNVVLTTHESIAVSMADGVTRAEGQPAVAYLHANVGLTNGLSHLTAATHGRRPVIVLNGLKARAIQNRGGFTTTESMNDLVHQYVKWDWQVQSSEALLEDVNRALRTSMTHPQGPTWIGISEDLLTTDIDGPPIQAERFKVSGVVRPPHDDIAAAASLLARAKRPVIIAGAEVGARGAIPTLVGLAERTGAVVVGEDRRAWERVAFPSDHGHYAGLYDVNREVLREADLVIVAGARAFLQFAPQRRPELPPDASVVHFHSDAKEVARIHPVDVGLVGDAALTLHDLLEALGRIPETADRDLKFLTRARQEHADILHDLLDGPSSDDSSITVGALLKGLGGLVGDEMSVVADATTSGFAALQALPKRFPKQLHSSACGSLGWGVGAALGLQLADPDRQVIAVIGDGGMQFALPGLWTAVHYDIPVLIVVINNSSYAAVGAALRRNAGPGFTRGEMLGVDISGVDLAAVARGFGVAARRIDSLDDLDGAVGELLASGGPALLEVMTDATDLGP